MIVAEAFDNHSNGAHKYIATAQFTLRDLTENGKREFPFVNPVKQKKNPKKFANSGFLIFTHFDLVRKPTFLDYIAGGCSLNLVAAVDFTASNMHPSHRDSLHN